MWEFLTAPTAAPTAAPTKTWVPLQWSSGEGPVTFMCWSRAGAPTHENPKCRGPRPKQKLEHENSSLLGALLLRHKKKRTPNAKMPANDTCDEQRPSAGAAETVKMKAGNPGGRPVRGKKKPPPPAPPCFAKLSPESSFAIETLMSFHLASVRPRNSTLHLGGGGVRFDAGAFFSLA